MFAFIREEAAMFSNLPLTVTRQRVYSYSDAGCTSSIPGVQTMSERGLFTHQTGHLLITLGTIFVNVSPFNQFIGQSTGDLLISVGRKLKAARE